jgi:hypothetical protein
MREWRAVWHVRIRRSVPGQWPKTDVREQTVHTPAELRALLDAARRARLSLHPRDANWSATNRTGAGGSTSTPSPASATQA